MKLEHQINREVWRQLIESIDNYIAKVSQIKVTSDSNPEYIRSLLASLTFKHPLTPTEAIKFTVDGLWEHQVHVAHPRYFGLFNPAPTSMGIAADALVAAFNPQLATWNHSPFSVEIEQHLIQSFGKQFGYNEREIEGTFTSGGTEANHTAILTALTHAFPKFASQGLRGLEKQPTLYVSSQSHHSLVKAARLCGLGQDAVRQIPVDEQLKMNIEVLSNRISEDEIQDYSPFFIVATAGSTNAGVIDPIKDIAEVAAQKKLWFHVDAAWGGAAAFVDEYKTYFEGIACADSVTFDAHKWLSVPMGAGLYLTRQKGVLRKAFYITTTYMPPDAIEMNAIDPYTHSMQCSRRFIGLKVFLSLAVAGWEGYRSEIKRQVALGDLLRRELESSGWKIVNSTFLPLVCFVDKMHAEGTSKKFLACVQEEVVATGKAWISIAHLSESRPVIRACINNFRTEKNDILILVDALNNAREEMIKKSKM